jgi:hypothetical protein
MDVLFPRCQEAHHNFLKTGESFTLDIAQEKKTRILARVELVQKYTSMTQNTYIPVNVREIARSNF